MLSSHFTDEKIKAQEVLSFPGSPLSSVCGPRVASAPLWVSVSIDTRSGARACGGRAEKHPGPPAPAPFPHLSPGPHPLVLGGDIAHCHPAVFLGAGHHLHRQGRALQEPPSSLHTTSHSSVFTKHYGPNPAEHRESMVSKQPVFAFMSQRQI